LFKLRIITVFILAQSFLFSQTNTTRDSLLFLIDKATEDTQKVYLYVDLVKHLQATSPNEVEEYCKRNLELCRRINFKRGEAMALCGLGEYHNAKGTYGFALEAFIPAARIYETLKDFKKAGNVSSSIGNTYLGLNDYEKALGFYKLSFEQAESASSKLGMAAAAVGIGNVYMDQEKYSEAMHELMYSKMIFENSNKDSYAAFVYVTLGDAYSKSGDLDSATYYARLALPIMEKYNSRYGQSITYLTLGNIDFAKDKLNSALNYYFKTLQISEEDKAISSQKQVCLQIFKLFEKKGNAEQALAYFKKYNSLKDSIYNGESRNKLFELETKYDSDAKEKQNKLLQQDQMIANKSLQNQRLLSYFGMGILILVIVFTYISFKNLKKQKKMNVVLQQQKELVEQSRKEILDSILYAKRIQTTILAHRDFINENISNNFVFFKPKDIVSGDFYWATKRNNLFYLAVCDSTGHGVPGAFMSLLSISFLNEAIGEKNILKPNEVFNYVRQKLIDNISREGQKDGFDGVLLCVNQDTKEITYAAANNRPVVINEKGLTELSNDRMPVGYGEKKEGFTLYSVKLEKNDTLYLFTDGYADQFGGPKGKKLMYKKLHEFLLNISSQTFESQTEALGINFESWKGELEQVDDVCVVGLKVA